jgi:hypothetical protein
MLYVTVHKALASVELFLSPMLTSGPRRHRSKVQNRVGLARWHVPCAFSRSDPARWTKMVDFGWEVSGTSKERGAVGFTDLGGLLLNQLPVD